MLNTKHNTRGTNHKSILNNANKQLVQSLACNVNTLHLVNTVMLSVSLIHPPHNSFIFIVDVLSSCMFQITHSPYPTQPIVLVTSKIFLNSGRHYSGRSYLNVP